MPLPNNTNLKPSIRFAIPSNGRMHQETRDFLTTCGFRIKARKRKYLGTLEPFPDLQLVFQRQKDILHEVEQGSISFGIIGLDIVKEYSQTDNSNLIIIHNNLGFGKCQLALATPDSWPLLSMEDMGKQKKCIRVATKFPRLTRNFLNQYLKNYEIVCKNGSLEVAPALGYSDVIVDLISSGETLRANNLCKQPKGIILNSQAVLIGNRNHLKNPRVLEIARDLLESFEATLRGQQYVQIFANMRRSHPSQILEDLKGIPNALGLQGPTISPMYQLNGKIWHSIHVIVPKIQLRTIIQSLRNIGGSGVVVSPIHFIFEEVPRSYLQLVKVLSKKAQNGEKMEVIS